MEVQILRPAFFYEWIRGMATRDARDGRDGPFSAWCRRHPDLDATRCGLAVSDIDCTFYKFRPRVSGSDDRGIKLMFDLEIKTWGAIPPPEQLEILFMRDQATLGKRVLFSNYMRKSVEVWYFGQFVLRIFGGDRPDDCQSMNWGVFDDVGKLQETEITELELTHLLGFLWNPRRLGKLVILQDAATRRFRATGTAGLPDFVGETRT